MHRRLLPFAIACLLLVPVQAAEPPQDTPPAEPVEAPALPEQAVEDQAVDDEQAQAGQPQPGDAQDPAATSGEDDAEADDAEATDTAEAGAAEVAADDAEAETASSIPLREIHRYVAVFTALKEAYVDPVDDAELMQSAIRGLLLELDPHSVYMSAEDARAFDENTTGAYAGVGVEVERLADGSLRVVAPIDETPAARAGIQSGDMIVAVDGEPLTPASHEGIGPLRGTPGTRV